MGFWLPYLAGLLTLPVLAGLVLFTYWACSRDTGAGPCEVCGHGREMEPGEHRNLTVWLVAAWHWGWWSLRPWHRRAWAEHKFNYRRRLEQH